MIVTEQDIKIWMNQNNRESEPQWGRETYQRECIIRGLLIVVIHIIIIISD
jgi:hypothetical protein